MLANLPSAAMATVTESEIWGFLRFVVTGRLDLEPNPIEATAASDDRVKLL